jgi:hypothetical protein
MFDQAIPLIVAFAGLLCLLAFMADASTPS